MKKCFKCGNIKDIVDFYKHPKMSDGFLGKCKECTKNDTKKNYNKKVKDTRWLEKERKRCRDRNNRLNYKDKYKPTKESKKTIIARYYDRFPEKKAIRSLFKLKPSEPGNHLHHWSYNLEHANDCIEMKYLDHFKLHRYLIYDQERLMYRRSDTLTLLDTKESHYAYFQYIINNKE